LLKAVSWRATGTLDTILVSFLLTGRIRLAFSIGCVEFFTKIGLYYVHERIWNRVPAGRQTARRDSAAVLSSPLGIQSRGSGPSEVVSPRPSRMD